MASKPTILRHSIVIAPAQFHDGWTPKFAVQLTGPIEMAGAPTWYFEGTENQGHVNERWTVRGWRFDADMNIVERVDDNGFGGNAPSKAFV